MESSVYADDNRHTCIVIGLKRQLVLFVPMSVVELDVQTLSVERFARQYPVKLSDYPVGRAAALYLTPRDGVQTPISPAARKALEQIADQRPSHDSLDDVDPRAILAHSSTVGENEMATAETPKKRKADTAKPVAKTAAKAPAKAAAKAAAKAPKAAATEKTRGRPPAWDPNGVFKVGPAADSVKKGAYKDIVDAARELKKFTIDQLEQACRKIDLREGQFRNTFAFGYHREVFVPA